MQFFINECSLHGQYYNRNDLATALKTLYQVLNHLKENIIGNSDGHATGHAIYKNSGLFTGYKAFRDEWLIAGMEKVSDITLGRALKRFIFDKRSVIDWNPGQRHSPEDCFECRGEVVTDTSMAELAERKLTDNTLVCALINFRESKFVDLDQVSVRKNEDREVNLDCVEDRKKLDQWLNGQPWFKPVYSESSTEPPTDDQTILADSRRFKPTDSLVQGRKVYKDIDTGHYWYVDNLHYGGAAHLEVFARNFTHLGEADLKGTIDETRADKNKKLKL